MYTIEYILNNPNCFSALKPKDTVEVPCGVCNSTCLKTVRFARSSALFKGTKSFRCDDCSNKRKSSVVSCTNCKKDIRKEASDLKKSKNQFCSRSCAATYNNSVCPKRKPGDAYNCADCSTRLTNSDSVRCIRCLRVKRLNEFNERKLKDVLYKKGDASLKFVHVRRKAQIALELEGREKKCEQCGWDKHVHVCHIKPLSSFSLDCKVGEANAVSNLKYLCPNHHWEFDNLKEK